MKTVAMALLAGLGMTLATMPAGAAGNAAAGQAKAAVCAGCHGPDGNSLADMWPKLAGQLPEYIDKQLHDFKAGRRANEQMSPMAKPLSDQDIQDVAAYFAKQQVKPAEGKAELLAAGERIFHKGKGRPDVVPACIGCHGLDGGGRSDWSRLYKTPPALVAPAIGSQHPAYIAKQLRAYKDGGRSNDAAQVMRNIASRLGDDEIAAVAQYAATLPR